MNITVFLPILLLWTSIPEPYLKTFENLRSHQLSCIKSPAYGHLLYSATKGFPCRKSLLSDFLDFGRILYDYSQEYKELSLMLIEFCLNSPSLYTCTLTQKDLMITGPVNPQLLFNIDLLGLDNEAINFYNRLARGAPIENEKLNLKLSEIMDNPKATGIKISKNKDYFIEPWINPDLYQGKIKNYVLNNLFNPGFAVQYLGLLEVLNGTKPPLSHFDLSIFNLPFLEYYFRA